MTRANRRDSVTAQERMDRLKRFARACVDRERARREFNAAMVQAFEAGISYNRLARFANLSEDTVRYRIEKTPATG